MKFSISQKIWNERMRFFFYMKFESVNSTFCNYYAVFRSFNNLSTQVRSEKAGMRDGNLMNRKSLKISGENMYISQELKLFDD